MSVLFTAAFWAATAERAVKTFTQALLAATSLSGLPVDLLHTDWKGDLSLALGATVLSVCTSLSGISPGPGTPAAIAVSYLRRERG